MSAPSGFEEGLFCSGKREGGASSRQTELVNGGAGVGKPVTVFSAGCEMVYEAGNDEGNGSEVCPAMIGSLEELVAHGQSRGIGHGPPHGSEK